MYGLPQSTLIRKQLPKSQIYKKFELKHSQQESFDKDIARIDIVAMVSSRTVPAVAEGAEVKEFYLLEVQLKRRDYDINNIKLLTKLIPQRMVFALCDGDAVQFVIYHTQIIKSEWMKEGDERRRYAVSLQGLNLDIVWENIVKKVGQIDVEEGNTLTEQIAKDDQRAKIEAKIKVLEARMAIERQPRRKREIFEEIKLLKKML